MGFLDELKRLTHPYEDEMEDDYDEDESDVRGQNDALALSVWQCPQYAGGEAAEDGVMYMLQDHTGATVSEGWIDGEGELSWSVDPSRGYFVTMITGNEDGTVMFPMTEIKRPAEMIPPSEGT